MKKILIPLLAFMVLIGCSKRENIEVGVSGEPIPITLNSGLLQTKAPIVSGGEAFTANVAGWETNQSADYTAKSNWVSTASVLPNETTAQGITLVPQQYYNPKQSTDPINKTIYTYMKAWYPARAESDPPTMITDGKVIFAAPDYKTDGTMDVLLASEIVGDQLNSSTKNLEFKHLLSQVAFQVIADPSLTSAPTLTSITIRNAELPTGINLVTDTPIYAPAADLVVPGITPGETTINSTAQSAGSPAMFKPFAGKTFVISIVTSELAYDDATVTITGDKDFAAGMSHQITITFKGKNQIVLTATVEPWKPGGSGNVTVE